jgi:hypothetical protein
MTESAIKKAMEIVRKFKPDGILVGERGLLSALTGERMSVEIHLAHSLNVFNDIDIESCGGIPMISPELSFDDICRFKSRRFIVTVHGPTVLMTTKEPIADRVLTDESGRRFRTRKAGAMTEILNCSDLGLFCLTRKYVDIGLRRFHLDLDRDVGKFTKIYAKIISGQNFDDAKIRRGFTTGHFRRGVE